MVIIRVKGWTGVGRDQPFSTPTFSVSWGDQALENTGNPQSMSSNQEVPADDEVGLVTRAEFMAMLDRKNQAVNEYFDKQIPEMTDRYKR